MSAQSRVSINDGAWHHLVGVRDHAGNITQLYVDGVLAGSGSGALTSYASTYHFGVGSRYDGSAWAHWWFDGSVDEVRMYNRTLSATEIWNLYQAGGGAILNSPDLQIDALEQGLAGYWKLDDGSGTSATDASTNGNTGTLTNGPTWTTGQIGGAVSFNGANNVLIGTATTYKFTTEDFTVSAWAKTSVGYVSQGSSVNAIIGRGFTTTNGSYGLFINNANKPTFNIEGNSVVGNMTIHDGQWHHLVGVRTGSVSQLWVDGVLAGTGAATNLTSSTANLGIGADDSGGIRFFTGTIDEVRIYNRALSAEEIAKLYKSTAPDNPDTSLKGYWSFNGPDVSGTTASDRSGQGNNATMSGGPTIASGKIGQALHFNEGSEYVKAASGSTGLTQGSISIWAKFDGLLSEPQYHFAFSSHELGGRDDIDLWYDGYSSQYIFTLASDWATEFSVGVEMTSDDELHQWHHFVAVWDTTVGTKLYMDGVLRGSNGTTFNTLTALKWSIGGYPSCYKPWLGSLDEARAYNRVLTATEVTNLYNLGR